MVITIFTTTIFIAVMLNLLVIGALIYRSCFRSRNQYNSILSHRSNISIPANCIVKTNNERAINHYQSITIKRNCEIFPKKFSKSQSFDSHDDIHRSSDGLRLSKMKAGLLTSPLTTSGSMDRGKSSNQTSIRKRYKGIMKSELMPFIFNLAMSDLINCLIAIPFSISQSLLRRWIYGAFLCHCVKVMQYFAACLSAYTLIVIGINRYFVVKFPLKREMIRRRTTRILVIVWIITIIITSPAFSISRQIYQSKLDGNKIDIESLFNLCRLWNTNTSNLMEDGEKNESMILPTIDTFWNESTTHLLNQFENNQSFNQLLHLNWPNQKYLFYKRLMIEAMNEMNLIEEIKSNHSTNLSNYQRTIFLSTRIKLFQFSLKHFISDTFADNFIQRENMDNLIRSHVHIFYRYHQELECSTFNLNKIHSVVSHDLESVCGEDFLLPKKYFNLAFTLYTLCMTYIVPVTILRFTYGHITQKLENHVIPGHSTTLRPCSISTSKKKRAIRTLQLLSVLFSVTWAPVYLFQLVYYTIIIDFFPHSSHLFNERIISIIYYFCIWMTSLNCCINPFIYGLVKQEYGIKFLTQMRQLSKRI
ncbi:hypothetical protein SNEBB_010887 [Seison nebaliae]|nr:hypothetical protein SNEBB_010887 [Seison nebaliae]